MKTEVVTQNPQDRKSFWAGLLARATILILLLSVAALATLAKDGLYYPRTNPARYVSLSTKMNVAHSLALSAGEQPRLFAVNFPPQPVMQATRVEIPPAPSARRINLCLSMQHRSPPIFFT